MHSCIRFGRNYSDVLRADYQEKVKNQDFVYMNMQMKNIKFMELNKLLDIDSEVVIENNQIHWWWYVPSENGVALHCYKF